MRKKEPPVCMTILFVIFNVILLIFPGLTLTAIGAIGLIFNDIFAQAFGDGDDGLSDVKSEDESVTAAGSVDHPFNFINEIEHRQGLTFGFALGYGASIMAISIFGLITVCARRRICRIAHSILMFFVSLIQLTVASFFLWITFKLRDMNAMIETFTYSLTGVALVCVLTTVFGCVFGCCAKDRSVYYSAMTTSTMKSSRSSNMSNMSYV